MNCNLYVFAMSLLSPECQKIEKYSSDCDITGKKKSQSEPHLT